MLSRLLSALFLVASVSAHATFQDVYVNGAAVGHKVGIRNPNSNNPVMDVSSSSIACNTGLSSSSTVISVAAGATLTTEWHHGDGPSSSDGDDPIASSHKGPVISYLAKVSNAASTGTSGLQWFKIWQDGLTSDGKWGVDRLIASKGKVSFKIPSCVPPGDYLLRHEIIALHAASSYPGAQFYMGCAQIRVTGSGSKSFSTVSFPGAYKGSDPGITINIYGSLSSYQVPGPSPVTC